MMNWKSAASMSVLAAALLPACSSDRQVIRSTPTLPATAMITDTRGDVIWQQEVPLQHSMTVVFRRQGVGNDQPATSMKWRMTSLAPRDVGGGHTTPWRNVELPGTPVVLEVDYHSPYDAATGPQGMERRGTAGVGATFDARSGAGGAAGTRDSGRYTPVLAPPPQPVPRPSGGPQPAAPEDPVRLRPEPVDEPGRATTPPTPPPAPTTPAAPPPPAASDDAAAPGAATSDPPPPGETPRDLEEALK